MTIAGWKTRSVFARYNIVRERDLHEPSGKARMVPQRGEQGKKGADFGFSKIFSILPY